jgi:serine/threonine protein kinase
MYKISKLLGQGAFGQVFVVFRFDDRYKSYAMKKISIYKSNVTYKNSIINEIKILKYCICPYIMKFIDCQYNGTNIDIIIPYIKRGDLNKIIKKRKKKI